ncbi:MAG: hypothetical protein RL604_1493 [Pseudomonadota bacterium]|jgi:hypothetical protein
MYVTVNFERKDMSRSFRRKNASYEYYWVLRDHSFDMSRHRVTLYEQTSEKGRRAIRKFHSDSQQMMFSGSPAWFRKIFKKKRESYNLRQMHLWLKNPTYEPVLNIRHKHSAIYAWW